LSEKANIELIALNETISGKRQLSTEMALQIESVMGIPASLLLNIQIQYNSFLRRK
jgi:plasmid maintenance system antidote protein VapI